VTLETFELDLETATQLVALAHPSYRAEATVKLTGGGNSAVFEVPVSGSRAVVVKVYSDLLHWKMEKEVFVYDVIARHGVDVPAPSVLAADDSKTLLPQNALVLSKLEGQHISRLLDSLDERDLVAIDRQVGALLRLLHEVGFEAFGYVGTHGIVQPHPTNLDYMRFQFDKKLHEFDDLGGDLRLRRSIERYVGKREDILAGCSRAAFCQNDCHDGNLLVLADDGGLHLSGLLDFENVIAGDPLLDLAKAHCYSIRRSERTLAALVEGCGDLRSDWREALDLYVLYHWLELWDWLTANGQTEPLGGLAEGMLQLVD
jgi:hygromycin-B 7''-O-kinase